MIMRTAALLALSVLTMAASKPVSPQVPAAKNLQTVLQVAALGSPSQSLIALADHSASDKNKDKDKDKDCKNKHKPSDDRDCRPSRSPD